MKKIVIAIDGFSSCGKSTFARKIAAKLGYIFIDSGAMYRGVTLYALNNNLIQNPTQLAEHLSKIDLKFVYNSSRGASDLYLNGKNVESQIRSSAVSASVSAVSSIDFVREFLVAKQQQLGKQKGIVMDGRDIGTVVFPDAELKIFMTADVEVRAQRRFAELQNTGNKMTIEEVRENIESRDNADQSRKISPLRRADQAIVLDNSSMTIDQQMEWVSEKIEKLIR